MRIRKLPPEVYHSSGLLQLTQTQGGVPNPHYKPRWCLRRQYINMPHAEENHCSVLRPETPVPGI
uniref:Uncharacterized protein n=1 Tax=Anguilla anguilla TaxID=7936 RepID=A0A0E9SKN1_ANGAN